MGRQDESLRKKEMMRLENMSFWGKWKNFRDNQKDVAALNFLLPRMEFHKTVVDAAPGILHQLAGISNLHAELTAFSKSQSRMGRILEEIFVQEVEETLGEAGPLPEASDVLEFMSAANEISETLQVEECDNSPLRKVAKLYRYKSEDSPDHQRVKPHLEAVKKRAFAAYTGLKATHHHQILKWASIPLWASCEFTTTSSTLIGPLVAVDSPMGFGGLREKVQMKGKRLPWTPLVDFWMRQHHAEQIRLFDTMCKSDTYYLQEATNKFVKSVMPSILFDLKCLQSELAEQIDIVQTARSQMMAGMVTLGITVGQYIITKYAAANPDDQLSLLINMMQADGGREANCPLNYNANSK